MNTADGSQYVQDDVATSTLCGNERAIVFACTVRTGGKSDGHPLGVLAVVFNWEGLAQTIVERTPFSTAEWQRSRACIVDSKGTILADSARAFGSQITIPGWSEVLQSNRGYRTVTMDSMPQFLGHARSPGYETYRTNWYSLLLQDDSSVLLEANQ